MQIQHRLKTSIMLLTILLLALTYFSLLGSIEYNVYGKKDLDQSQDNKQNFNCNAGEDNNNSCNNISISRHDGGSDGGNQVQVSEQNFNCNAGEDNNNSCNNFDLKEMISDRLKMLRQT